MILGMFTRRYCVLLAALLATTTAHAGLDDWFKEKLKSAREGQSVDTETVAAGLREALEQGTQRAVQTLGRENGFWSHPQLRIPMPEKLQKADKALRRLGQDKLADEFVQSLNRAAEQATPAARDIFLGAIRRMSIRDAYDILKGQPDAATLYFRRQTETPLAGAFRPIVTRSTEAVGVTARYKKIVKRIEPLGIVDTRDLNLDDYVTNKAMDALFYLVAEEEKRIRADPVARTTELLRKVFK
jgi:hypothetical protein